MQAMTLEFLKMHGLGNDFVVLDARKEALPVPQHTPEWVGIVKKLANRRMGIGFDQLLVLHESAVADVKMDIFNADGSSVGACGNATRCIAWLMMRERSVSRIVVETAEGLLECEAYDEQLVCVDMGRPRLDWQNIPLSHEMDTLRVPHGVVGLPAGVAVSMGNPHLVIFVEHVTAIPLQEVGSVLEHSPLFPQRVNVTIAHLDATDHITMKTWERGAGETLACGTAACATMVAARRLGLVEPVATLKLPGGNLVIEWMGDQQRHDFPVMMTGAVSQVYQGRLLPGWDR